MSIGFMGKFYVPDFSHIQAHRYNEMIMMKGIFLQSKRQTKCLPLILLITKFRSKLRAGSNKCLTCIIALILLEVLDESVSKILSLCLPL